MCQVQGKSVVDDFHNMVEVVLLGRMLFVILPERRLSAFSDCWTLFENLNL